MTTFSGIYVERARFPDPDKRGIGWRRADLTLLPGGAITLTSWGSPVKQWTVTFEEVTVFSVQCVHDVDVLARSLGGHGLAYVGAWLLARWVPKRVIYLEGSEWVRLDGHRRYRLDELVTALDQHFTVPNSPPA